MALKRVGAPSTITHRPLRTKRRPPTYIIDGTDMAADEDRLDRNYRNQNEGADRLRDQISSMSRDLGILTARLEGLSDIVKIGLANVDITFREINSRYATKEDLASVSKELDEVRRNLTKAVWIVLGAVLIAGVTLIFKAGLVRG